MRFGASHAPVAKPGPTRCWRRSARAGSRRCSPRRRRTARCCAQRPADVVAAHVRVGRRAAAGRRVRRRGREDRHPDRRRHRLDRDAAHLHRLAGRARRGPARAGGRCRATRRGSSDEDMQHAAAGRGRPARRARPDRLPLPRRPAPARLRRSTAGTSPATRSDGRGRLLLVPGAHRRHDHLVRLQHLRLRGRGGAARAPRGAPSARSSPRPTSERGHVVKAYVVAADDRSTARRRCRTTSRRGSRRTSTRAGSSSSTRCRARRPARCSATCCGSGRAMRRLQPPGWPRPRGYANGIAADGRLVFVAARSAGTRPARSRRRPRRPGAPGAANVVAVLAEAGAGPEHVVRMTWYVTDRDEYLAAPTRDRRRLPRGHGPPLPGDGRGRGRRAGRSAKPRESRSRRRRSINPPKGGQSPKAGV